MKDYTFINQLIIMISSWAYTMDGEGNAVELMNWSPKSLDLGVHNTY